MQYGPFLGVFSTILACFVGCSSQLDPIALDETKESVALPLVEEQPEGGMLPRDPKSIEVLKNKDGQSSRFNGIGAFTQAMGGDCTFTLIRPFMAIINETTPAYILTAAHCVADRPNPNDIIVDRLFVGDEFIPLPSAVFNVFVDTPDQHRSVAVTKIKYATMKGTDIAIMELETPLLSLIREGFEPLVLSPFPPMRWEPLEVVGRPVEGITDDSERVLRRSQCYVEAVVDLSEGGYHWDNTTRTSCESETGGSSGSPVISPMGDVIGVLNTVSSADGPPCELHYACETGRGQERVVPDKAYAVRTSQVAGCFDMRGNFDLDQPFCFVDREQRFALAGLPDGPTNQSSMEVSLVDAPKVKSYQVKFGRSSTLDCRSARGYTSAIPVASAFQVTPSTDGYFSICVVEQYEDDGALRWNALAHATRVTWWRNTDVPRVKSFDIREQPATGGKSKVRFTPLFENVRYQEPVYVSVKFGKANEVDCSKLDDYRYLPLRSGVADYDGTCRIKICAMALDVAGNRQKEPTEVEYPTKTPDASSP